MISMKRLFSVLLPLAVVLAIAGIEATHRANAQSGPPRPETPPWMKLVLRQAMMAPRFGVAVPTRAPATIPQTLSNTDSTGVVTSYQPQGATIKATNPFFAVLGTNGRSCFTCHQPQAAWSMTPQLATSIFLSTKGTDPLFSPVDGENCPNLAATAKTLSQKAAASSQLLSKGNIRIFMPIPANAQFQVRVIHDPYGCENNATYGLPSGGISMYRRVMNSSNLTMNGQFGANHSTINTQGAIMWDGREASLESQFIDATLGHAQAANPPTDEQISGGVAFESGVFTAQSYDNNAKSLTANGATGGPVALSQDPPFMPATGLEGMTAFDAWANTRNAAQASIKRGQDIFNNRQFTFQGVAGANDTLGNPTTGTCSGCHSNQNIGSSVNAGGKHLGIGDNSSSDQSGNQDTATFLPPTSDQPLFSFLCPRDINGDSIIPFFSNPVTLNGIVYDDFRTTDPGMAMVTGKCADLGKFKVPRLRGLAARGPYFHGGNAATLSDVVDFYNKRFNLELNKQERQDLINFLGSL
jgi:cytochrome c peroxidase